MIDGALLLADACASPEELDAQIDQLTAALDQLKSVSRRRFAAAASADSPEWGERFALMGLPEGARSWRGRLALHLVALADAWHGLHQDAAQAPAEVLAGVQIAQIGEHTRLGRDFEARRPGQAQRQVQRLLAAVLADPGADCAPLRDGVSRSAASRAGTTSATRSRGSSGYAGAVSTSRRRHWRWSAQSKHGQSRARSGRSRSPGSCRRWSRRCRRRRWCGTCSRRVRPKLIV